MFVGGDAFHPVASGDGVDSFDTFQLSGRFLTFVYSYSARYGQNKQAVEQYDLRKRRLTFKAKYDEALTGIEVERERPQLAKLVSDPEGDAAWVIREDGCWGGGLCGVQAIALVVHDAARTQAVVSYHLEPESGYRTQASEITDLGITGHGVSWHHLGEPEAAPLP